MPFPDRKPVQPNASEKARVEDYEVCVNCGTLFPIGERCPTCELTFDEYHRLFTKFKRSE